MENNSIIIIGGGFAGLSAGIYGQMNGYKTRIFEMHDQPGGLCTSWKRKGFTIDGCIHWLVGSSHLSSMHRQWEEVGVAQGREIVNIDEYLRYEAADGRTLVFYTDVNKLETHLIGMCPEDEKLIREFTGGIRMCLAFDMPASSASFMKKLSSGLKLLGTILFRGRKMKYWMKTTARDFAAGFSDPALREAIHEMWFPDFSMLFMLFTFAWLHKKNAGYPIGGSLPMSKAMEEKYTTLGGQILYKRKVEKIIVENSRAAGIILDDGSEHRAGRIISVADGYSTIFRMLGGKFMDDKIRKIYDSWKLFPPLIFVSLGVNRDFGDEPMTISGMSFPLKEPVEIGGKLLTRLPVHLYNQDPTFAPAGKTTVIVMFDGNFNYWKKLSEDRKAYLDKKQDVALKIIELMEQRYPGIAGQVEMVDVATPVTFERYTGNWQGSFEGWLITPENSSTFMKRMEQTLPGLENFYMCGQWVEPGGGLPTSVMSARRLLKLICKEDRRKFVAPVN